MKLKTVVLSSLLFVSLAFGQEATEDAVKELTPVQDASLDLTPEKLTDKTHVAALIATVQNQRIQIATLQQRIGELLLEKESLLLSHALKPQLIEYSNVLRKSLIESGADSKRCKIEDLVTGKIVCVDF